MKPEFNAEVNAGINVTPRQFLRDFAFTCAAAFGTGAAVGALAFIFVRFFLA